MLAIKAIKISQINSRWITHYSDKRCSDFSTKLITSHFCVEVWTVNAQKKFIPQPTCTHSMGEVYALSKISFRVATYSDYWRQLNSTGSKITIFGPKNPFSVLSGTIPWESIIFLGWRGAFEGLDIDLFGSKSDQYRLKMTL